MNTENNLDVAETVRQLARHSVDIVIEQCSSIEDQIIGLNSAINFHTEALHWAKEALGRILSDRANS